VHTLTFQAVAIRLYTHGGKNKVIIIPNWIKPPSSPEFGEVYVRDMDGRVCVHKFVDKIVVFSADEDMRLITLLPLLRMTTTNPMRRIKLLSQNRLSQRLTVVIHQERKDHSRLNQVITAAI
jgi:hypothetical protein